MQIDASHGSIVPASGVAVAYTGTSASSSAINSHSGTVRLVATTDCFVEFGPANAGTVTAAANTSMFLPAYMPEYFSVANATKIAAIRLSADGTLYISQA